MVYFDQIQDELTSLVTRINTCLRRNAALSANKRIPLQDGTAVAKQFERCFIYKDAAGGDWIRSGKVML